MDIGCFESDRLQLRLLKPNIKNARKVLDYYDRNKFFLKEWDPTRDELFYTIDAQKKTLKYESELIRFGEQYKFWISKKNEDKLIGNICFSNIVMGNFRSCFTSYKLDEKEINNGYITEALDISIAYMFEEIGLHRVEVNIIPRNMRSRRVVEKLGFVEEGISKKYLFINGVWEDHLHYAKYNEGLERNI